MALFRSLFQHYKALHVARPTPPYFSAVLSAPSPPSLLAMRAAIVFPQLQFRAMGYKLKTKAAVKKRFKVNKNGLVKRAQANKRHIATKKTRERIRRLGQPVFVQGKIRKNILRMLGKK
ncbi:putative ribosomal protein L35 [Plasmopara halstedii]